MPQEWLQILDGSRAGGVACRAERGILLDAAARGEPNGVLEAELSRENKWNLNRPNQLYNEYR